MLRRVAWTIGVSWLAFTPMALADGNPSVRLSVRSQVPGCVDERALRDAVAARLGYQPFHADATSAVRVTVTQEDADFVGQVERLDAAGQTLGLRKFASPSCAQLQPSIELALAIAIDPLSLTQTPPPATPLPPEPRPTAPPSPGPPLGVPLGVIVEAGGLAAFAIEPLVTGGITVGAELRWPTFSIGLEGQDDFPTTSSVGTGSVQVSSLYASVVPCLRLRYFGACAIASGGAWQINSANLVNAVHTSGPFAALGVRALGELPVIGPLSLRLTADLVAPLVRETIASGIDDVWTTPSLAGEVTLWLAFRLR